MLRSLTSSFSVTVIMWANVTGLSPDIVVGKIEAAVGSGYYNQLLTQYAALSGAGAMVSASAVAGAVADYRPPTIPPTPSPKVIPEAIVALIAFIVVAVCISTVASAVLYREGWCDRLLGRKGHHRHQACGMRSDVAKENAEGGRRYMSLNFDFQGVHTAAAEEMASLDEDDSLGEGSFGSGSSAFGAEMYMPAGAQSAAARNASIAAGWRVSADLGNVAAKVAPTGTPSEYVCPIGFEVMTDPYIAADGVSYDKANIDAYLKRGETVSPSTGLPLKHSHLWPNAALKTQIQRFIQ